MPDHSNKSRIVVELADEVATRALGALTAQAYQMIDEPVFVIFMEGNLGMGKTCFCQGLIADMGYAGRVKSPTYTLVEPYELETAMVSHFDLYRLADPEELEFIGGRDYFSASEPGIEKRDRKKRDRKLCLVEWPEKGQGFLPEPDLEVRLSQLEPAKTGIDKTGLDKTGIGTNGIDQEQGTATNGIQISGRRAELIAHTESARNLLQQLHGTRQQHAE